MFHIGHRTFIHALVAGGLLSLPLAARDATAAPMAAMAQQAPADAEIVAKIRQALSEDKALAGYVSTLKVVVSDGLVTLKGAVKSEADKKAIGKKVEAIVGEANVMNNLFVSAEAGKPRPETP
jgi:osmotically-inducible protein OsmY